jgi:hypothetical protein
LEQQVSIDSAKDTLKIKNYLKNDAPEALLDVSDADFLKSWRKPTKNVLYKKL